MSEFLKRPARASLAARQGLAARIGMALIVMGLSQACQSAPDVLLEATRVALSVQQTVLARDIEALTKQPVQTVATAAQTPSQEPPPTAVPATLAPAPSTPSFEQWLSERKILLYEDMAGDPQAGRWVAIALRNLHLDYYDCADRIGDFQAELSSAEKWDLVIYARENRNDSSGTLFGRVLEAFDRGASVVLEYWDLDENLTLSRALVSTFMECGVELQRDWYDVPMDLQVLYAHNTENPIHGGPNPNVRMSSFNDVRWEGDIGDLLELTQRSESQVLYGPESGYDRTHATVVSCEGNRLILQTHSTHQYASDRSIPLWENYIHNALRARYHLLFGNQRPAR